MSDSETCAAPLIETYSIPLPEIAGMSVGAILVAALEVWLEVLFNVRKPRRSRTRFKDQLTISSSPRDATATLGTSATAALSSAPFSARGVASEWLRTRLEGSEETPVFTAEESEEGPWIEPFWDIMTEAVCDPSRLLAPPTVPLARATRSIEVTP
jgi:hypothetical protein